MRAFAALTSFLTAAAVLLAACGGAEAPPPTSGITGQVLLGPVCPVLQAGTPCPDQPFQATIDVWNAQRSKRVASFTTDAEGRFRVPLRPGEYYLEPRPPQAGGPPTPIPQTVSVLADRFVQVTVHYDSGIR